MHPTPNSFSPRLDPRFFGFLLGVTGSAVAGYAALSEDIAETHGKIRGAMATLSSDIDKVGAFGTARRAELAGRRAPFHAVSRCAARVLPITASACSATPLLYRAFAAAKIASPCPPSCQWAALPASCLFLPSVIATLLPWRGSFPQTPGLCR